MTLNGQTELLEETVFSQRGSKCRDLSVGLIKGCCKIISEIKHNLRKIEVDKNGYSKTIEVDINAGQYGRYPGSRI